MSDNDQVKAEGGTVSMGKLKFGFSKVIKKPNLLNANGSKPSKVEMIESIEGSSINVIGGSTADESNKMLVIPMLVDLKKTTLKRMLEQRQLATAKKVKVEDVKPEVEIKAEPVEETLDQQAARELIEDLQNKIIKEEVKVLEVPINPDELPLEGAEESTMDDYERVPINDFGKAMLRGMGWKDEDNKDKKEIAEPVRRPHGMGLGAEKAIKKQPLLVAPSQSETLEIRRKACVKILAGKHKNFYGTVSKLSPY